MVCATGLDWARGGWQQVLQVSRERDQPTASDHQQLWGQGPPWQQPWHCSKLIKNVKSFACLFFKYVCDDTGQMWNPLHVCKCKTHNQDQQLNKCEILWLLFFLTALLYITTLFRCLHFYTQILYQKEMLHYLKRQWTSVSDNTASAVRITLRFLGPFCTPYKY